ncbi:MAG TPA: exodeoxyribonuclease III [Nannocystaceae bacterium]|nr:exodeoxyribonuclease III [Nannocystaceae bacterium]
MLTVVAWNVNSLRARLPLVRQYLAAYEPDVLCLQETRIADAAFPHDVLADEGYVVATTCSGSRAGVAIASRIPIDETVVGLPGFAADRRIACRIAGVWIDTVYVPTRTAIGKVEFLDALHDDQVARFADAPLVLCGDFNICFDARDYASPSLISAPDVHPNRPEDLAFRRLVGDRLIDCLRVRTDETGHFTWFPMTPWALRRNYGMRLDYVFATPPLAQRLVELAHDRDVRQWPRPSDHVPMRARFERP